MNSILELIKLVIRYY